jgi:nucleoside-diphosphate-sugar epimerase
MSSEEKIVVWGTGEEKRDLLYVDDLVDFVLLAIKNQEDKYNLLNCGYGSAVAIKDLVAKIVRASDKELRIEHDLAKPTINTSLSIDSSLAEKKIGWTPKVGLDEGIAKTIIWWQENMGSKSRA